MLIGLGLFYYAVWIEPDQLIVRDYSIALKNWSPALNDLKVVVLTDLHVGALHINAAKLHKIIDNANQQNPDLILLLGDSRAESLWKMETHCL